MWEQQALRKIEEKGEQIHTGLLILGYNGPITSKIQAAMDYCTSIR